MWSALMLALAITLVAFSLLAVFPAPTYLLWQFSILATEWGHWIALFGALFLTGWRISKATRAAAVLALIAAFMLLSPLIRSLAVVRALPEPLALGTATYLRALLPERSSQISRRTLVFAQRPDGPLRLDLYQPVPQGNAAPVVVVIHGGSWRGGDRMQLAELNGRLANGGYAVASIDYRLLPRHLFPAQLEDVHAAIAYLKQNAAALHLDASRIALLGRSAGGQLALLAAYTSSSDPAIRGAISLYAPTDLPWGYDHPASPRVHDSRGVLRAYIGGTPAERADGYRSASPIFLAEHAQPTLLIHGARDELVFVQQSRRMATALVRARRPHTYIELPWATHGCDYAFHGPCGQISAHAVERFLETVFARESH